MNLVFPESKKTLQIEIEQKPSLGSQKDIEKSVKN
jgi:hypothetical protein